MGAPAGETPATPINRIPAYMLPKKPTYRQAQLLLRSTKSSRPQASRSIGSRLVVLVDESYSAEGEEEEQPSCDKVIPPKVCQYAHVKLMMLISCKPTLVPNPSYWYVLFLVHRTYADVEANHVGQIIHGWRIGGDIDWSVERLPIKGSHYMLEGES